MKLFALLWRWVSYKVIFRHQFDLKDTFTFIWLRTIPLIVGVVILIIACLTALQILNLDALRPVQYFIQRILVQPFWLLLGLFIIALFHIRFSKRH
jgi:type VI protein secretion system component VasK